MIEVGIHQLTPIPDTVEAYPLHRLQRVFVPGEHGPAGGLANKVIGNIRAYLRHPGIVPVISFKPAPNTLTDARWGEEFARIKEELTRTTREVWLIPYHEPEDNMDAATFRRLFNIAAIAKAGDHVKMVYSANTYTWRPNDRRTSNTVAWTDVPADIFAADSYSGRSWPLNTAMWEQSWWNRWSGAVPLGASWALTERGFYTLESHLLRAETILREAEELAQEQRLAGIIYWNTGGHENQSGLTLDTLGKTAVRKAMQVLNGDGDDEEPGPMPDCAAEYMRGHADGYLLGYQDGWNDLKGSAVEAIREVQFPDGIEPPEPE